MKKKEILSFPTIGIHPEGIMLSKVSPRKKEKYCKVSLRYGMLKKKSELIEAVSRIGRS